MEKVRKIHAAFPALTVMLLLLLLPAPHSAFAQLPVQQDLPSSRTLLPVLRNPVEYFFHLLPETPLPSEMLLQERTRTALFGWGAVEPDNSLEDADGDENSNAFIDAPVTDAVWLPIVLVILYAFRTRMTQITRMYADRHCEGGSPKQSSGTQMTRITRMYANLYNKRICADLRYLRHLRSPFDAALSRRDNMLVERKNIHTISPTVPSGTECAGGDNVRFSHSHSVPYGTVGMMTNGIFYQHSVPDGTAPAMTIRVNPYHPRSKRANTQVRPCNFQIFKFSNHE